MRAAVLVLFAACGSSSKPPATSSAAEKPYIDPGMCQTLATSMKTHCGFDMLDQCMAFARLAEAAACVPAAQRSFDCGLAVSESCNDEACCKQKGDTCIEGDRPFDGCMRGYCSGQPGHPDCVWFKD